MIYGTWPKFLEIRLHVRISATRKVTWKYAHVGQSGVLQESTAAAIRQVTHVNAIEFIKAPHLIDEVKT